MSENKATILHLSGALDEAVIATLEGRTFQVHAISPTMLRLYAVEIGEADTQCPAFIGGEQCGRKAGHQGKHWWANGD